MVVSNSDIEIIFQNTGSFIGIFVKSIRSVVLYYLSLSNKSFKKLTGVGKVQCCLESILSQRFDIYFCFPTLNVHPSSMNPLETVQWRIDRKRLCMYKRGNLGGFRPHLLKINTAVDRDIKCQF